MLLHKDGGWHIRQAGGATSQSIVTWPLRGQSITGKPWLLSPASSQRRWGSGNRFLYGCGPAQVGFGPHWKASPFLLRLGRSTLRLTQWVRRWLGYPTTTSPLSLWSRFSIFTGVQFSSTGRPHRKCPLRGTALRSFTRPCLPRSPPAPADRVCEMPSPAFCSWRDHSSA